MREQSQLILEAARLYAFENKRMDELVTCQQLRVYIRAVQTMEVKEKLTSSPRKATRAASVGAQDLKTERRVL
jgi:hypothetical protein